ncbi:MAG: HNH endonuclease, partial [Hyphomicrobium sp.]|nr:HNH endonuclease [Hyphomicrobium sp.]
MTIDSPQTFVVREECQKAASQNGFRRSLGVEAGWAAFGSTTAHGIIHLAASGPQGPWFLALDHPGVIQELNLPAVAVAGPGIAR